PMWQRGFTATAADNIGVKVGNDWFGVGNDRSPMRQHHSKSPKRKMASAMIAKIPLALSRHIASVYRPAEYAEAAE
ncbi:MAG TPA: hypothetical protein VK494_09460, partial [Gemmatimonadaceae bacterium]|nr:hypothetical protein [Gemmatimonadaceae bacterium]